MPAQLEKDLRVAMKAAGIPVPESDDRWQAALTALKVRPAIQFRDLKALDSVRAKMSCAKQYGCMSVTRVVRRGSSVWAIE